MKKVLCKITNFYKNNKFICWLFLCSFLLRLLIIIVVKTTIYSDFQTMYEASLELINGTKNYTDSLYFLYWGYQMGHVIYQALLLNIINNVLFLKIINCLITSFIPVFIYLISKKISNDKSAKIVSISYTIFLFPLLLNSVLTNQHLPLLLMLISIYLLININYDKKIFLISFIIGLLLSIGNILRSEGIIYISAIIIYSIYLIIKKYQLKKVLLSLLTIIITYLVIFNVSSYILIKTNISPNGLQNMNPTWKFVLGFNYDTNGMYSSSDASKYITPEASKIILKTRLKDYEKIPMLFLKKIKILWFNSDLSWSLNNPNINPKTYNTLNIINQLFIIVFNVLAIISIFINNRNISKEKVLILLILLLFFGAYLLIEVMPRYAYSFQPLIYIISSITIAKLISKKRLARN